MSKELGVEFRFSSNRQLQIGVAGGMDGENRQEKKMHQCWFEGFVTGTIWIQFRFKRFGVPHS